MYSIVFHIAGIAVLEICFYFYYIGPIESKMFQNNILLLIKEPLYDYDHLIHQYPLITNVSEFDSGVIDVYYNEYNEYNRGKLLREHANYNLFISTLYKWCVFVAIGFFIYGLECKYNQYIKKDKSEINYIIDDDNIETNIEEYTPVYRKNSIDETNIYQPLQHKYRNKIIYYVSFGGCVLLFEYLFFQYIVLYYKPLSINELRYIILHSFLNEK